MVDKIDDTGDHDKVFLTMANVGKHLPSVEFNLSGRSIARIQQNSVT